MTNIQRILALFLIITSGLLILILFPKTAHEKEVQQGEIGDAWYEDARPEILDAYFAERGMPLAGHGELLVTAADAYGVEWNFVAAIGVIESTGGKAACGYNPFGWGSCRDGVGDFGSFAEAIVYVTMNLGGHNPRTAGAYAGGLDEDLMSYNGNVDPTYPARVKAVMQEIALTPLPSR